VWQVFLKGANGYECRIHSKKMKFDDKRTLRKHLFLFHRHQDINFLMTFKINLHRISVLPVTMKITVESYMKLRHELVQHLLEFGDESNLLS
jgi:hypothetical protein